jgi:nucleotide-binding universal stress UspA family protein
MRQEKRPAANPPGIVLALPKPKEGAMTPSQELLKVLIPIDFSETSRRALAWAYDYATRAPCELHVLHVVEDQLNDALSLGMQERLENELWAITQETASELVQMVPDRDGRARIGAIHRHVVRGKPAAEILRTAEKLPADMIVMGTHGRTGLAGLLIGSVAEKTVRRAHCPVVCVKPGHETLARVAHVGR